MPRRVSNQLKSVPYKFTDYHNALCIDSSMDYFALLANSKSDIRLANALKDPTWLASMKTEMDAHKLNHTWDLTPLPSGQWAERRH